MSLVNWILRVNKQALTGFVTVTVEAMLKV